MSALAPSAWASLDRGAFAAAGAVLIAALLLAWAAWQLLRSRVRAKPLMTRVEREVLGHLEAALPWCRVYPQVSLGALLQPARWLPQRARGRSRYAYAARIADSVLEDRRSGEIVALVELDDKSHDPSADRIRDRMTARAGYLTIRLPARQYPTRQNVAERVTWAISNAKSSGTAARDRSRTGASMSAAPGRQPHGRSLGKVRR